MNQTAKVIVGAVTDFVLTASGVLTGAMVVEGAVLMPSPAVLVLAALFGFGASAKHVRAMYLEPAKL